MAATIETVALRLDVADPAVSRPPAGGARADAGDRGGVRARPGGVRAFRGRTRGVRGRRRRASRSTCSISWRNLTERRADGALAGAAAGRAAPALQVPRRPSASCAVNPTEDIDLPRYGRKLPDFLTVEEVERLLAAPDRAHAARRARRRHAGDAVRDRPARVRAGRLRLRDVNFDAGYLRGLRQGAQGARWCPSARRRSRRCARYVEAVARGAARGRAARSRRAVPHAPRRAMTRQGFWKLLGRYALVAGIRKRDLAAQAAPLVRHPPRGARRRPARGAGHAGPRRHRHDARSTRTCRAATCGPCLRSVLPQAHDARVSPMARSMQLAPELSTGPKSGVKIVPRARSRSGMVFA